MARKPSDHLKPRRDCVLVRPHVQKRSTLIELTDREIPMAGTIVAIGAGVCCPKCRASIEREYAVGDAVLFSWAAGQELRFRDEDLVVLREDDVLAVIDLPVV